MRQKEPKKVISVSEETHEYIRQHGEKGESFDSVIRRLLGIKTR